MSGSWQLARRAGQADAYGDVACCILEELKARLYSYTLPLPIPTGDLVLGLLRRNMTTPTWLLKYSPTVLAFSYRW